MKYKLFLILCFLPSLLFAQELVQYGTFELNTDFPNLVTNGDFESWAAGDPVGWTVNAFGDGDASEVGPGQFNGGGGSGAVNLFGSGGGGNSVNIVMTDTSIIQNATQYHIDFDYWDSVDDGEIGFTGGGDEIIANVSATRHYSINDTSGAGSNTIFLDRTTGGAALDFTFDNVFFRVFGVSGWLWLNEWNLTGDTSAVWTAAADGSNEVLRQVISSSAENDVFRVRITVSAITFAAGDTYLNVTFDEADGVQAGARIINNGTYDIYIKAGSTQNGVIFQVVNGTPADTLTLDSVSVVDPTITTEQIVTYGGGVVQNGLANEDIGPIGIYNRTGKHNSEDYYTSQEQHPDGAGGVTTWFIWNDGAGNWTISTVLGTNGTNYWVLNDPTPTGAYTATGNALGTMNGEQGGESASGYRSRYTGNYRGRR